MWPLDSDKDDERTQSLVNIPKLWVALFYFNASLASPLQTKEEEWACRNRLLLLDQNS